MGRSVRYRFIDVPGVAPEANVIQTISNHEFILQLKLGSASPAHYQKKFGVNVLERFGPQLAWLQNEGFATVTADEITIHRAGLLQIDRLLQEFFLPHHRHARYT